MIDRKKVIKGLECCVQLAGKVCMECPYANECAEEEELLVGSSHLAADALTLLREQGAIKPTKFQKNNFRWEIVDAYRCGNCQHELDHVEKWSYCPKCGKAVKWDD